MLELAFLFSVIIILLIYLLYKDNYFVRENFTSNTNDKIYHLNSCPKGYKKFYNNSGDIVCCNGEIVANRCLSDDKCVLSGDSSDIKNCVDIILDKYNSKAKEVCPTSLPNYFEVGNNAGCTNGNLNDTLSGPAHPDQPICIVYPDFNDNFNNKDSCSNRRALDSVQCFGNNCTKEIQQPIPGKPILIAVGFTDNTGMHRIAYSRESMQNFLNATNPNWQNQGIDLTKNINVAEVAKAYYIDRTLQQSDVQF
jgi:hypothetical protein